MVSNSFPVQVSELRNTLKAFALKMTKDAEDSEDLIQETMYKALRNQDKFAEGSNLKAWLFTIMRNIFINNYRVKKRRNTVMDGSDNQFMLNSGGPTVVNESTNNLLKEDIEEALSKVKADIRVPFMMYYKGYKYQEIADILNLNLGTVKSRIFHARKAIQTELKELGINNSKI